MSDGKDTPSDESAVEQIHGILQDQAMDKAFSYSEDTRATFGNELSTIVELAKAFNLGDKEAVGTPVYNHIAGHLDFIFTELRNLHNLNNNLFSRHIASSDIFMDMLNDGDIDEQE